MEYLLTEDQVNMRLDVALASVSELSRSALTKLIKNRCASIDGVVIEEADFKIGKPLTVKLQIPNTPQVRMKADLVDFEVVYEDKDLLIVNKPAGIVVHPGVGNYDKTLANGLMYKYGHELSSLGGVLRPGIVHRLDKDTSGLMMIAKNDQMHALLSDQISKREVKRHYAALVWGIPVPMYGKIENYLRKSPTCHTKVIVCSQRLLQQFATNQNNNLVSHKKPFISKKQGKYALTHYEFLSASANKEISLLRCKLSTGRTHQIRVHLAHIGHSIIGDQLYGNNERRAKKSLNENCILQDIISLQRQALHAYRLSFVHPIGNHLMNFQSKMPSDMNAICDIAKIDSNAIFEENSQ